MRRIITVVKYAYVKYPVLRGMTAFSILWPSSNSIQQMLDKSRDKVDVGEIGRYCFFGTFVISPTVYAWFKLVGFLIPGNTLKHVIAKIAMDINVFGPLGQIQFYMGISLLERRTWDESVLEVKKKLFPTWKAAACFWPPIQTVNYLYVPERNRVVIMSMASFVWTFFLSYMHHSNDESTSLLSTIRRSLPTLNKNTD